MVSWQPWINFWIFLFSCDFVAWEFCVQIYLLQIGWHLLLQQCVWCFFEYDWMDPDTCCLFFNLTLRLELDWEHQKICSTHLKSPSCDQFTYYEEGFFILNSESIRVTLISFLILVYSLFRAWLMNFVLVDHIDSAYLWRVWEKDIWLYPKVCQHVWGHY